MERCRYRPAVGRSISKSIAGASAASAPDFKGSDTVSIVPTDAYSGEICGGRTADNSDTCLTRALI
jgi:hypothetical protein